jgi:hypothetical protein
LQKVGHCRSGNAYAYPVLSSALTVLQTTGSANLPCVRHTSVVMAWALTGALVAAAADMMRKLEVGRPNVTS